MEDAKQLIKIMEEDLKVLEDLGFHNLCLVKIQKPDKQLIPSHIVLNYWFDFTTLTLKAVRNEDGTYNISFRDNVLVKSVLPADFDKELSKYSVEFVQGARGVMQNVVFKKKTKNKKIRCNVRD